MTRNYMRDYGGPVVPWAGSENKPNWAALFPIPESKQAGAGAGAGAGARDAEDSDGDDGWDDDDCDFWLSPRMACLLYHACSSYGYPDDDDFDSFFIDEVPAVVQPWFKKATFFEAYREGARRIRARLAKGLTPNPNCTGEEMALHRIINLAQDMLTELDSGLYDDVAEDLEAIPASTEDEDFDRVSELAFQDHDVLMLYDMPGLIDASTSANPVLHMMDFANMHPNDWFKPFRPERINDHMP